MSLKVKRRIMIGHDANLMYSFNRARNLYLSTSSVLEGKRTRQEMLATGISFVASILHGALEVALKL